MIRPALLLGLALALVLVGPARAGLIWAEAGLSADTRFVRQPVLLYVDLFDDLSIVEKEARPLEAPGLDFRFLGAEEREARIDGERYRVHRYRWQVIPLVAGDFTIRPPVIEYRRMGGPWEGSTVQSGEVQLAVEPLPLYLPVYLPVDRPVVERSEVTGGARVGQPGTWRLSVTAAGLETRGVARLVGESLAAPGIRFGEPEVTDGGTPGDRPLERRVAVEIPFEPREAGTRRLPDLQLAHVDPATGRLARVTAPGPAIEVAGRWRPLVVTLAAALAGLLVLAGAVAGFGRWRRRHRGRRALADAESPRSLRAAVLAHCDPGRLAREEGRAAFEALEGCCFGGVECGPGRLAELKAAFERCLP